LTVALRDMQFDIRGRDRTQRAFDSATRRARTFHRETTMGGQAMGVMASQAKALGLSLAAVGFAGAARGMRSVISEASEMAKVADKVGVTTDELQRMQFGFGQAGVAVSDLERNLEQWSKRVSEAAFYGGKLADILEANNIPLRDVNGNMRSSVDLLRDYANLVKNAGSSQEQMTLATEGFGRSGSDMILALRDGAAGMEELMSRADEAGGVLENSLLRRAEELDDRFDKLSRTIELRAKVAILEFADESVAALDMVAAATSDISDAFGKLGNSSIFAKMNELMGVDTNAKIFVPGQGLVDNPDRFGGEATRNPHADVAAGGTATKMLAGGKRTIIPNSDDVKKRTAAAKAAQAQADAYTKVAAALGHELELLGLSETEQRVLNEIRRAGVESTGAQADAIRALVVEIESESSRLEEMKAQTDAFRQSVDAMGSMAFSAFDEWASGAATAEDAMRKLAVQVARSAAEAAVLGSGPLAGLFGAATGGGGGFLTSIVGALFGRAGGGRTDPNGTYVVGENGPELLHMGGRGGEVVSNDNASSRGGSTGVHVTLGWAEGSNGNIAPIITGVSQREIRNAAPALVGASVQAVNRNMAGMIGDVQRREL
tara:strand:+ start:22193 stop:24004 length:1812 start_codon:yes stop_codon:yes gene_type:complete